MRRILFLGLLTGILVLLGVALSMGRCSGWRSPGDLSAGGWWSGERAPVVKSSET
jgi:hypothetical protein